MIKNRKGFILVETVVVMSIVMIALLGLYTTYVTVISRSKQRKYYDNINDVYLVNTISKIIEFTPNDYQKIDDFNSVSWVNNGKDIFDQAVDSEIQKKFVIHYIPAGNSLNNITISLKKYLETTNYINHNLIVIEYELDADDTKRYASLEVS